MGEDGEESLIQRVAGMQLTRGECGPDPTRRMSNCDRFYQFSRDEIEMHHFSFVRNDMTVEEEEEEEEERSLIVDLKRHTQLAVAWNRTGL